MSAPDSVTDRGHRWHLVSLRPRGRHEALRRAAARHDGGLIALSSCRLRRLDDDASRQRLDTALAADRVVFTSPEAVRAATALRPLHEIDGGGWFAVGAGTAAALKRAGAHDVAFPARMDSEGLLDLPALRALDGSTLGLVTAPGGRGMLLPALQARGAQVIRADVYAREPLPPPARAIAMLRALRTPLAIAVSSGEALAQVLAQVPADVADRLRGARTVVASARLAVIARGLGLHDIVVAAGPRPAQLVAAVGLGATPSRAASVPPGPI
ncbi:uroporphyrinogen-III synthase [Marilutibacter chinensis]|uniref:Uroporphyrinogen-III synthase n=1 Tax=Marilutibacter chinensis TaxID=2912247 RepID=A0ABS9HXG7_9GAMM|nr:uroporphyrinogen-III synthase [Lysobacter chinensis]MCF7222860.1 uroporphyrinogen-III synthase [Lysobacter chinensis]